MKITSKETAISGPEGNIHVILDLPQEIASDPFVAINCHPHPLHGGTMTNKVVHTVSRSIAGLGIVSLRFNFRGVGSSEGTFGEGRGEQADLIAVAQWLQNEYPGNRIILSGFSFGAYVSALAADALLPSLLISIAPPVARFDFDGFIRPEAEWVIIMGDQDELVELSAVTDWAASFHQQPELVVMEGASHFFHGRLAGLRENVELSVKKHRHRQD